MKQLVLDAGTTWSKIIETEASETGGQFDRYLKKHHNNCNYYILPSSALKEYDIKFDAMTGHMSEKFINTKDSYVNEIIALAKGAQKIIKDTNAVILDLGSRDAKWARFKNGKFSDLDWNTSCASSTGATIEMLLKFYDVQPEELSFTKEKYNITCGIFGLEKIMDDIANGETAPKSISKFIHGIAFNSWNFTQKSEKIYLSGGFCENKCFVEALSQYCEVALLGRFVLCEGILS